METIKIYNHAHYGDIFYSRMLINTLKPHFNIEYYHNQKGYVLKDLENINEFNGVPFGFNMNLTDIKNGVINSWIGQGNMSYLNNERGCDFTNHFKLVSHVCSELGVKLGNSIEYLPTINYDNISNCVNIKEKMGFFKNIFDKIILICDGDVKSGQSENFDFKEIIIKLSEKYKNYLFISTNNNFNSENILQVHPTLTSDLPDLLEIGYISTLCDVIIGRSSGPFCYTHTLENLFDKNKTFISFTHVEFEGKFLMDSNCKNIWSNNFNLDSIYNTIDENL